MSQYMVAPGARLFMKNGKLVESMGQAPPLPSGQDETKSNGAGSTLALAGAVGGLYHGYKRHKSVLWALGWGAAGGMFPIITGVIAYAQGFGKSVK